MARWYVTDGSTITELPAQLEPAKDAYFPPIEANPFRPPGGTTIFYEGDLLPRADFLTLVSGIPRGSGGYALYVALSNLKAALATATHVVREEDDGTLTWPLSVGVSHLFDSGPLMKLSNVWECGIKFAISSVMPVAGAGAETYYITTEAGEPLLTEAGDFLVWA
jgi:hypothetical protein